MCVSKQPTVRYMLAQCKKVPRGNYTTMAPVTLSSSYLVRSLQYFHKKRRLRLLTLFIQHAISISFQYPYIYIARSIQIYKDPYRSTQPQPDVHMACFTHHVLAEVCLLDMPGFGRSSVNMPPVSSPRRSNPRRKVGIQHYGYGHLWPLMACYGYDPHQTWQSWQIWQFQFGA